MLDLPPILPDPEEDLRNYLICVEKLPMHEYERNQEFWPRKPNPTSLFYHENSPLSTTLKVIITFTVIFSHTIFVLDTTRPQHRRNTRFQRSAFTNCRCQCKKFYVLKSSSNGSFRNGPRERVLHPVLAWGIPRIIARCN